VSFFTVPRVFGYIAPMTASRKPSVLVIGAGGVGCAALGHLAARGVGRLGLADPDRVEASNLPRQLLYDEADIGRPKAEVAAARLGALAGASVRIEARVARIAGDEKWLGGYDVVIDAADRAATKLALHDALVRRCVPYVYAAATGWSAQVLAVSQGRGCLCCLFGDEAAAIQDGGEAGILGPVAGLSGVLAARQALHLARTGQTDGCGRFRAVDARRGRVQIACVRRDEDCPVCGMKSRRVEKSGMDECERMEVRPGEADRYARQVRLAEVGEAGQERIRTAVARLSGDPSIVEVARVYLAAGGMDAAAAPGECGFGRAACALRKGDGEAFTLRAAAGSHEAAAGLRPSLAPSPLASGLELETAGLMLAVEVFKAALNLAPSSGWSLETSS